MRVELKTRAAQITALAELLLDCIEGQLERIERLDELERERGGRWRESELLAPGEEVIEDARLS